MVCTFSWKCRKKAQKERKMKEKKTAKSKQVCEIVNTFAMCIETYTKRTNGRVNNVKTYAKNVTEVTTEAPPSEYNKAAEKYERKKELNISIQHSLHAKIKRQQ